MHIKFVPIILLSAFIVGCTDTSGKTPDPDPGHKYEKYTVDFTKFDLSPYSNILQSKDSRFDPLLLEYFQHTTANLVTSFTSSGDNKERLLLNEFPGGYKSVQGLIIGSQNDDGEIEISFSKTLHKVSFEIEQYYKIYEGYDFGSKQIEIQYDCQDAYEDTGIFYGYSTITVNDQRWIGSGETYRYNDDYTAMYIDIPETNTASFIIDDDHITLTGLASERCRIYSVTLEFEIEE